MVRLRRALPYGAGIWVCLVVVSLVLLPLEDASEAVHESLKSCALVAIVLAFTVRRLSRPDPADRPVPADRPPGMVDGLVTGLVWAAVAVLLDLGLFLLGAFNIGLGAYFADVASSYLVIPVTTAIVAGYLTPRVPSRA